MAMKIVIVKDATTDHLVPLTLEDSDSIADLIRQWSAACGRDGSEYIFKTLGGEVLSGEVLISELSVPLSGYSSLEIVAERTARLFVCIKGPGSFGGKLLEIQLALSFTIGPLASVVCQVLQIPEQELEFRTKASVSSLALPPPLRGDVSLAEQQVQEDEEIDCDFSFDFLVSSSWGDARELRLTCRGGTAVSELLLPGFPRQRLLHEGRSLDGAGDAVALLSDHLAQRLRDGASRMVRLEAEREVGVRLAEDALSAWSGETVGAWLGRTRPASLETPLWHRGRLVSLDATVASLQSRPSDEPVVLASDPGLELTLVDVGGRWHEMLLPSGATVDDLLRRVLGEPGVDLGTAGDRGEGLGTTGDRGEGLGAAGDRGEGLGAAGDSPTRLRAAGDLFLALDNGRRLSPLHVGLAYCGVGSGSTVLLRRPTEELLLECEGWCGRLVDVPRAASFAQLLGAARKATGRALDDDCELVCRCGRVMSRGSSLPSSPPCCPSSPRVLRLHRRLEVTVTVTGAKPLLRHRRRATDTVRDVLRDALWTLDPDDSLGRRLAHRGTVLQGTERLCDLAAESELALTLQEQVVFVVEGRKRCQLARVWPGETWAEVRRLLRQTEMVEGNEPLQLNGEVVRDEDPVQMKNGDVLRVLVEEVAAVRAMASRYSLLATPRSSSVTSEASTTSEGSSRSSRAKEGRESSPKSFAAAVSRPETGKKSRAPLSSLSNGRGKTTVVVTESATPLNKNRRAKTSIHVECENAANPSFVLSRETPMTVASLRGAVAKQWDVGADAVVMKQYRAFTKSGTLVISADNTAWVDEAGVKYPHDDIEDVTVSILTLEDHHPLFIPGCHRWSICAQVANPP